MHALHKILVKVPKKVMTREEMVDACRDKAESITEDSTEAFDWREVYTAGRWSDVYPENVMFASENLDAFIKEIEESKRYQDKEIDTCVKRIGEVSINIGDIVKKNRDEVNNYSVLYEMKLLAELLSGSYVFDSGFYDAELYTAKITKDTIRKIKRAPEKWALVMFDYHI